MITDWYGGRGHRPWNNGSKGAATKPPATSHASAITAMNWGNGTDARGARHDRSRHGLTVIRPTRPPTTPPGPSRHRTTEVIVVP
ncbi:hypothetical protein DN051_42015 (plasmid) [Streptomyces cadmiisoli]|uniref:Uncharacterized protein n=1 Tax=Streptomyces cadmiisoli TaxID=2184053 RepID=A0A2Z4JF35_9ACTN|nr:hypothetical protein DN051_42015 [Streptomyces cadmiisoli]